MLKNITVGKIFTWWWQRRCWIFNNFSQTLQSASFLTGGFQSGAW